ncbi:hypothetical protein C8R47DRAFT_1161035 [Mycena vitilis]|nr:hypothetical protein C8R47DRAFT_1161035 [Mycena vitilis]
MAYDTAHEIVETEEMISREPLNAQSIAQLLFRLILPTGSTVLAELSNGEIEHFEVQAAKFYFTKGGRVEYALDAIIDDAEAAFGVRGTMLDMYQDNDEFLGMPSCANDREFDIVRKNMIGVRDLRGPYSNSPRHADWTVDGDDSADEEDGVEDEDGDGDGDEEDGEDSEHEG